MANERHQDIPERLFDANLQVVTAVHIPTMLATSELSGELRGAIEGGRWDGLTEVLGWEADDLANGARDGELGWLLTGERGWAVLVSAAMVGPWNDKRTSRALYTGWRKERWFRADAYEHALLAALEWVESDPAELVRNG